MKYRLLAEVDLPDDATLDQVADAQVKAVLDAKCYGVCTNPKKRWRNKSNALKQRSTLCCTKYERRTDDR